MIKKPSTKKTTITNKIVTTTIIIVRLLLDPGSGCGVGDKVGLEVVKKLQPHVTFIGVLHDCLLYTSPSPRD